MSALGRQDEIERPRCGRPVSTSVLARPSQITLPNLNCVLRATQIRPVHRDRHEQSVQSNPVELDLGKEIIGIGGPKEGPGPGISIGDERVNRRFAFGHAGEAVPLVATRAIAASGRHSQRLHGPQRLGDPLLKFSAVV